MTSLSINYSLNELTFFNFYHFRKRADFGENDSQIRFGEAYPEYLYQHKYWNYQPLMVPPYTR